MILKVLLETLLHDTSSAILEYDHKQQYYKKCDQNTVKNVKGKFMTRLLCKYCSQNRACDYSYYDYN